MKAVVAIVLLGIVALSSAGAISAFGYGAPLALHHGYGYAASPLALHSYAAPAYAAVPYSYNTVANYKLGLDTSLPGSAYASYPYAAAPTAYGYGVTKVL